MNILSIFVLLLVSFNVAGSELVQGVFPITKEKYVLYKKNVGVWNIYTLPEASENLVIVSKKEKPVMSSSLLGIGPMVSIHDPKNSSLTSVDVSDKDNDGVYDHIMIYQQDGSNDYIEIKLFQGRWSYKEHNLNKK